jgi:two-component system cell cycle sensor histidine kinase/response regulator CckA
MTKRPTCEDFLKKIQDLEKRLNTYRALVDNSPDILYRTDLDGRIVYVSPSVYRLSGYTVEEALGMKMAEEVYLFPNERQLFLAELQENGQVANFEAQLKRKDGSIWWASTNAHFLRDSNGQISGVGGVTRDISKLKSAEAALKESEKKYRHLFETAMVGIYRTRIEDGKFLAANQRLANLMGYQSVDRFMKEYVTSAHYTDPNRQQEMLDQIFSQGTIENFEIEMERRDGTAIQLALSARAYPDQGFIEGVVVDITARKQAEKELQDSKARLTALSEASFEAIFFSDKGVCLDQNQTAEKMFGYTRTEAVGKYGTEWIAEKDRARVMKNMLSGNEKLYEVSALRKDGTIFPCEIQARMINHNGRSIRVTALRDITERRRAAGALQESEERFRKLVEESPLGISLIAKNGRYKYVNPWFVEMFGYTIEDVPTGRDWFKKAFPDDDYREKVVKSWIEGQKKTGIGHARARTYTVTCKNGSRKEIHFRPVTMENLDQFVICEDITQRLRMEQQFQQAQKFEAVGTLAGGIAHDFNNLLMGIQGRASLMALEIGAFDPQQEHIEAIEAYVRSATNLTKQLLGFARGGKYEVKPVDLNDLMSASAVMFGRTRKEIKIHTKTHIQPVVVEADKRQIEQLLLNIFVNAWQAMPDGGELFLATTPVILDDAYCLPHQVAPGRYAQMSVTDTGIGMGKDIRKRIFDPFFTTKDKGRGTGLGLASAYGIVKNHGGTITVYSEVGRGTTFNIYLPASEKDAQRDMPAEVVLLTGSETILLVDDEEMIIDVGCAMLEKLGYRVMVAEGGEQAVAAISKMGNEIDLVIIDLIMPGMDGGKTFDRIRAIHPAMPVILSSGYALNGQATDILKRGCNGFIQKPFNIAALSKKVRKVLEGINT